MPAQSVGKFFDFRARVVASSWNVAPEIGLGMGVVPEPSHRRSSGMEQVIELGTLKIEELQAGGSGPRPFNIELDEARLKEAKKVRLHFDGITSDGVTLMNDYEGSGAARNVGVQLLDSQGKVLHLGGEGQIEFPAVEGLQLTFAARLVCTSGPVEAGEFSSFSECAISYA
ncbi:fimbrial protein [Pseudomonas chlororaphis]|uniref:Fimbrial protein n=1 Tax=Pseudomonas chlororaphis TaxID=587753 RepID=A0A1Q8ENN9_9PSED|nr:fimbrial protein [Pseudomonas chlororaphis]OLF53399.1 fimbrial protein [Pseudomonas chlororaphis]